MTTKAHAIVDGKGRPLVILIATGQGNDSPMFCPLMAAIYVPRSGPGRPRSRPDAVLGDKAYSARAHRQHPLSRRIKTVIPEQSDQISHRRRRGSLAAGPLISTPLPTAAATTSTAAALAAAQRAVS